MVIYNTLDAIKAEYNGYQKTIIVQLGNVQDQLRPCLEAQLQCIKEKEVRSIIVDCTSASTESNYENLNWIDSSVYPQLEQGGVRAIITVLKSGLSNNNFSAKYLGSSDFNHGLLFHNTESLSKAMRISDEYKKYPNM